MRMMAGSVVEITGAKLVITGTDVLIRENLMMMGTAFCFLIVSRCWSSLLSSVFERGG